MRVVSYGTFNKSRREANVSESFDRPPKYVLAHASEIHYNGTNGGLIGCKRDERGHCDRYYDSLADLNASEES